MRAHLFYNALYINQHIIIYIQCIEKSYSRLKKINVLKSIKYHHIERISECKSDIALYIKENHTQLDQIVSSTNFFFF